MKSKELVLTKNQIANILFFISYGLYILVTLLNTSFYAIYINSHLKLCMIICISIIIFKEILCERIKIKEIFYLLICSFLSLIMLLRTNGITIFPIFFFLYGARRIEFKKIAKFTLIESVILFLFIILSAKSGIILNYISTSNGRTREYLGFRYSLYSQMIMFNITALYLYICSKSKKTSVIKFALLMFINYLLFKYTDSRLSFYLAILLIIITFIISKKPKILDNRKIICLLATLSFIISAVFSLYMIFHYDSSNIWMRNLNETLGNRLLLGYNSLREYPINLFGHDVKYIGNGLNIYGQKTIGTYNYVDCLYLNILEKYGTVFSIVYLGLLTYVSNKAWKDKNYVLLIILSFYALHGIIDDLEIYLYYNTFWFIISEYFIDKRKELK